jgi:hypothetical protein
MFHVRLGLILLAAASGMGWGATGNTGARISRLAALDTRPAASADSVRAGRRLYLESERERLRDLDRRLDRLVADSLARYRADSVYRREVLAKVRAGRDHVETLMDDLAAVEGSIAPAPWDSLKSDLRLSLDSLYRLYLSADSSGKAELAKERRARLDPRIEDVRSGGGREWRRERRDVEESRRN